MNPPEHGVRGVRRAVGALLAFMKARPQGATAMTAALLGMMLAWLCTSPPTSMGVNWDTAGYAADIGSASPWARLPWNSHYGVGHVYWLMMHLMAFLGLPPLDGIRLANALALAWSAAALTFCARALGLRPALRLAAAGLYLTAWGTLLLVATWEDNVLVQPAALSALALCLDRIGSWRGRDGVWAGLLVGLSSLMSWQGAAYLLPVGYAALLAGHRRTWAVRLRDALVVPLAFAGTRALWTLGYWLSASQLSLAALFRTAFERPSPNFLPDNLTDWLALLTNPRDIMIHAGIGVTHELGPAVRDMPGITAHLALLGGCLMGAALLLWGLSFLLGKRVSARVRFLATAFVLLTAATVIYLDVPVDKFKRYDYLPIFAALAIPTALRWLEHRFDRGRDGIRRACTATACLLILVQALADYRWNRQWHQSLWDHSMGYVGRGGQTWLASIRSIHEQNPQACSYIFAYGEVEAGRYQLEIPAVLSTELGRALVIGAPHDVFFWPRPLPMADLGFVKTHLRGCEWLSPQAQILLANVR